METRTLPHTDLTVSRVALGTMTFGAQTAEATARRMVETCFESGVNFFDTANVYNHGAAETILGNALRGRRARAVIATKVRGKMGDAGDDVGLSRAAIRKAIEASLQRLGTDYVDIYYLHQPDYAVPIEETMSAMDELVREGKVRYVAVSNYAAWQVAEIHCVCSRHGFAVPHISQPMYNLLARGIEEEFLPFCKSFKVAVVPYNPLAGGLLTGKQRAASAPIAGSRFDKNQMYLDRYWHADFFAAVEELEALARDANLNLVELSLGWLLAQPLVDSILLGASRIEQLEQNLAASVGAPLTAQTLQQCDAVWKRLRGITPKYNR
ncbi:MAG: aldo/keto reductase [Candidatus Acidiferrales bacterium]